MIDLKQLRDDPQRFIDGAEAKGIDIDFAELLDLDSRHRDLMLERETARSEQNKIGKDTGPRIGELKGRIKKADDADRAALESELAEMEARPVALKADIQRIDEEISAMEPALDALIMAVPQPPDPDVPRGLSAEDNVELRQWSPDNFDPSKSFAENRGYQPRTHVELVEHLGIADFQRAVKIAGTRHYALRGDGMRLHQAVLQHAFDLITSEHDFLPMSVPVIVREECMVGTGFFPSGREQAYHIEESRRGAGHDLYLAGTGEVGLMGLHGDEIIDAEQLPLKYATVSTCFRREAGAGGRETAGLYRVHQFDKVEQVVICRADEAESRQWHATMIDIVETMLQDLRLPYRLFQCCTADLGPKNADMIDIECWMPGRGPLDSDGRPQGDWGETHSASRLYDFQCRRLNMRYRDENGKTVFCHSLNNTVLASPRILIPILEMYQQEDGSVVVPEVLRGGMGKDTLQPTVAV
ncbi:MAG: serine--tRNA ligase [Phycisphaerales bacterium]|jgi:seryl-tRNA synthetase|nr:serine--tRNA ligase [Phycisphaerales bacterium]